MHQPCFRQTDKAVESHKTGIGIGKALGKHCHALAVRDAEFEQGQRRIATYRLRREVEEISACVEDLRGRVRPVWALESSLTQKSLISSSRFVGWSASLSFGRNDVSSIFWVSLRSGCSAELQSACAF